MTTPTTLVRAERITAVWFGGHVISAWYDDTGDACNLFKAHVLTSKALLGLPGSTRVAVVLCEHNLPPNVCMLCAAGASGSDLVGG